MNKGGIRFLLIVIPLAGVFFVFPEISQAQTWPWLETTVRAPDTVYTPYTAITADSRNLFVLGRQYKFDDIGLPENIYFSPYAESDSLLAKPSYIKYGSNYNKGNLVSGGYLSYTAQSATSATLKGLALYENLSIGLETTIEFDGFARVKLTLTPLKSGMTQNTIALVFPLKKNSVRYIDFTTSPGDVTGAMPNYPGLLSKFMVSGHWKSSFVPTLWLGDEKKGFVWCAESTKGWKPLNDGADIEIVETPDAYELTIYFVRNGNLPPVVDEPVTVEFAWMATPAKPQTQGWENYQIVMENSDQRTRKVGNISIVWNDIYAVALGTPRVADTQSFTNMITNSHNDGYKILPYIALADTLAINNPGEPWQPELTAFGNEWNHTPCKVGWATVPVASGAHWGVRACPRSSFMDYELYYLKELITQYDVDGVYIDNSFLVGCDNAAHGCGFIDRYGKRCVTYPVFAQREFLKNIYGLFDQAGKTPIIMVHSSSNMLVPSYSFATILFDGEQYQTHYRAPYSFEHMLPLDYFRAHMHGEQFGVATVLLATVGFTTDSEMRDHLANTLIHDTLVNTGWMSSTQLEYIWSIKSQFGIGTDPSIKFNGYWNNTGIKITDTSGAEIPGAYVSFWASTNKVLAVLAKPSLGSLNNVQIRLDKNVFGTITNVLKLINGGTGITPTKLDWPDMIVLPGFTIPEKDFSLIKFTKSNTSTAFEGPYKETLTYDHLPVNACGDNSKNGNTIKTTVHCNTADGPTGYNLGQAAQLQTGNGAFMLIPHDARLIPTSKLTVEAWVKRDSLYQDTGIIVSKDVCNDLGINPYGYKSYVLSVTNAGEVYFELTGDSETYPDGERYYLQTDDGNSTTGWVTVEWCHVAATYDGQYMRIYVNGAQRAQGTATGTLFKSLGPLVIGNTTDNNFRLQFDGKIDEVYIWTTARTLSEIQYDAENPPDTNNPSLIGCWRFENVAPQTCPEVWRLNQGMQADLNKDCIVDFQDLAIMASEWLSSKYEEIVP